MPREQLHIEDGFSLVEVLLAVSLLAFLVVPFIGAYIYGVELTAISGDRARAANLAEEGLEAVRSIRDGDFRQLTNGPKYLKIVGGVWTFSPDPEVVDIFTRTITINDSVPANPDVKEVTATVTWQQTLQRSGQINLHTRLSNWHKGRGGMFVYGDGGTTTDAIRYRILDPYSGVWGAIGGLPDVDSSSTNRAVRAAQVYASGTRDEKVVLTRHYDGREQYIYATTYHGASGTWDPVPLLLSRFRVRTYLDVQNFHGTYLANGDFLAMYSDNTMIPKYRTWNGSAWSLQGSLPDIGAIPTVIIAKNRPGSNEVMAAFFDQGKDTNTVYYDGTAWTLHPEHANNAPSDSKRLVDFAWSPNNLLTGALVYTSAAGDKSINIKIWSADGLGAGTWGAEANTVNQASNVGTLAVIGRQGADEFLACDKDASGPARIICYRSDFTPTWTNPVNQIIAPTSDNGIQRSFDIGFEGLSGDPALAVYSDRTPVPKMKRYNASTSTWDPTPTDLPALSAAVETVRVIPDTTSDDPMVLLANTAQDVYSIVWDGTFNAWYSMPTGKAFSTHGINGSHDDDFWYDFAWDKF